VPGCVQIPLHSSCQAHRQTPKVKRGVAGEGTYPLSAYLNSINWTSWGGDVDTERIIHDLKRAIANRGGIDGSLGSDVTREKLNLSQLKDTADPLPSAGTHRTLAVQPDTDLTFYIERDCDRAALQAIQKKGVTVVIRASVQMGKSHLLTRISEVAIKQGKRVVVVDLQLIDSAVRRIPALFFQ
jgi:hypothetical protein